MGFFYPLKRCTEASHGFSFTAPRHPTGAKQRMAKVPCRTTEMGGDAWFSMALLWKDIYESDIFEGIPGYLAMIMSAGDIFLFQCITTFVPQ